MVGEVIAKVRFWISVDGKGVSVEGLEVSVALEAKQRGNMFKL
jgi:hypothetical protein